MSSTTQLTTFSDLYVDLQNRVRAQTSVTATETLAKRAINIALQDMHLGFDYRVPWAERRAVLRTQDDYSTGTVVATRGSVTITGTGSAWNTANAFGIKNMRANGKIVFAGSRIPYTISAVATDTSATLTTAFTETTVTDGTYSYFEDEYDLAADFLRPIDLQQFSDALSIDLISRTEARRLFLNNTLPGRPRVACIVDLGFSGSTTPIRRVRLFPPPNDFLLIPYSYVTSNLAVSSAGVGASNLSADSDEPIVPLRYRHAIVLHALYNWYRDRKDDTRSQESKAEYTDIMTRLSLDQEEGAPRPQFRPRLGSYIQSARRPYRGGRSGRFDIGGRFDRME